VDLVLRRLRGRAADAVDRVDLTAARGAEEERVIIVIDLDGVAPLVGFGRLRERPVDDVAPCLDGAVVAADVVIARADPENVVMLSLKSASSIS
jgi:hypothetical protein